MTCYEGGFGFFALMSVVRAMVDVGVASDVEEMLADAELGAAVVVDFVADSDDFVEEDAVDDAVGSELNYVA